jgi:hypothetical protein
MRKLTQEILHIMPSANLAFTPCSKRYYAHCTIQYQQLKFMLVLYSAKITLYDISHLRPVVNDTPLHDPLSLDAEFWVGQIKRRLTSRTTWRNYIEQPYHEQE